MIDRVASHYGENLELADAIAEKLRSAGKDLDKLTTAALVVVDEFHIRGRKATLEFGTKTRRSFTRGTPRGFFGRNGLMAVHSSSVSS